jgi:hypothetical protein
MQIRLQGAETTKLLQRPTNPAGPQVRVKSILKNKQQLQFNLNMNAKTQKLVRELSRTN